MNPIKHSQVKPSESPELSVKFSETPITQVPLLQSIRSQIDGGGSGVSQNCPVNPEKHSQMKISESPDESVKFSPKASAIQVPLLQSI